MDHNKVIRVQRTQAWERAKGELRSMLHTFWNEATNCRAGQFEDFEETIEAFIKDVEGRGLQE